MSKTRPKDKEQANINRSTRWGKYGFLMEERVFVVLEKSCWFENISRHKHNSKEDSIGQDFTVFKDGVKISFGVTISRQYYNEHIIKHPDVPQLLLPVDIKDETILKKVQKLFD